MKQYFDDVKNAVERGFDKNIRISVTGLSGAGKTAFITSLVNQILNQKHNKRLPFWLAHTEKRITAARVVPYQALHIPEFSYQKAIDSIIEEQAWPESTRHISQVRLSVKYKVKNRLLRKLQSESYLNIDIIDYPGEWLLDLPLLNMSFKDWSKSVLDWCRQSPKQQLANDFLKAIEDFDPAKSQQTDAIKKLSHTFRQFLLACKKHPDIYFIQPGRFILPGDLENAPVLDFFPCELQSDSVNLETNYSLLESRFDYYKEQIVKPFFKEYFAKVDRQVLLVDASKVLNAGYDAYKDLQLTLANLLGSFKYGLSNWFERMFSPKINRLLIVASKSDHVPPTQHPQLNTFLKNMLRNCEIQVGYHGVEVEHLVASALETTDVVTTKNNGEVLQCVRGFELGSGKQVINYPGKIPTEAMTQKQWQESDFNFIDFAVPELAPNEALPHQNMDKVIQQLLGDKFL